MKQKTRSRRDKGLNPDFFTHLFTLSAVVQSQQRGDATLLYSPCRTEVIQYLDGSNYYIEK